MYQKELENISKLEPIKRYQYFIKKIADSGELWLLENDNADLAISMTKKHFLIPIWVAEGYIKTCRNGTWKEYKVKKFNLENFENNIINTYNAQKYLLDVMPINNKSGFIVSFDEFIRDLNIELTKYL